MVLQRMIDNDTIKTFVQETLGCGCPEEVFRTIDCNRAVRLSNEAVLNCAITIGNRLLIYVMEKRIADLDEKLLAFLVSAGKKERDSRGLNRFRLVIVADEMAEKGSLIHMFEKLQDKDGKIHLHVIKKEENIFTAKDSEALR